MKTENSKSPQQPLTVDLIPNRFYRPAEAERLLGRRCIEALRAEGLRTVGRWYLGQSLLEYFTRAVDSRSCQRVPHERISHETEHQNEMGKTQHPTTLHPVSKPNESNSISSQIESLRKLSEKKVSSSRRGKRSH